MKKAFLLIILALLFVPAFSQESEDYPVRLFETSILIDNQTVTTPFKGMLEFEIHHRFGTVNNGFDDLFGLWGPSKHPVRTQLRYNGQAGDRSGHFKELHGTGSFREICSSPAD